MALCGPEHGIYGDGPAGDKGERRTDERTGWPGHSRDGATRKPTAAMLRGLDAGVDDWHDTGCRSYTFGSTLGLAMEACGEAGVEFVVLDRPNPLGGLRVEGTLVEQEKLRSFLSQWNVPCVEGLTGGELARMINDRGWIKQACKLTVVPMRGWRRPMVWADTGLPWVPASPHVPRGDSPLFQVATGMIGEIGNVSIGAGYTLPFEGIGLPKANPPAGAEKLNGYGLVGVTFRPLTYKPYCAVYEDEGVGGVQV